MLKEEFIQSFDGTKIFIRKNYIENPKGVVILIHGLSESADRYCHIAKFFNEIGYNAISVDNRGNGRSGFEKGNCNSFHDFLDDTHEVVKLAKKEFDNVYLLGHSLGGFIVNAYGAKYNDVKGIISSGAVGIFLPQVTVFRVLPFKPLKRLNVKNTLSDVLSHDPQVRIDYEASKFVNKTNRLNLFGECFVKGVRYLRRNIQNLTVPILYLHGTDDKIVPNKSTKFLYENVGSKDKEIHMYDGFYHEIFNEVEKEKVFEDVKAWMVRHE